MNSTCHTYIKTFSIVVSLLTAILFLSTAKAQEINNKRGVEVAFVNKKTAHLANELSSNILKVKNNSNKEINFKLNLSVPAGWAYVSRRESNFSVKPYDSLFIPINIARKQAIAGDINHVINASLISDRELQFASAIWYMSIKKESNWNAALINNKVFFLEESTTAGFAIRLQNQGNAEEHLKIGFLAEKRLRVFHRSSKEEEIHYFNTTLPINTDTILYFTVEKGALIQKQFRRNFESGEDEDHSDVLPLKITIQNNSEDLNLTKSWRGAIDFIKSSPTAKLKEHTSNTLPLTVEANVDNILDNSTLLSLSLYGNTEFENNHTLSYRLQTSFFDNFLSYRPYFGDSHYLGYFTPKSSLEVGNINGFSNFGYTSSGNGAKITHEVIRNNRIGAFYLKNQGFLGPTFKEDYGAFHQFAFGRNTIENSVQINRNDFLNTNGKIYSNRFLLNILRSQTITFSSSFSTETYTTANISKNGYAYMANYFGTFNKLSIGLNNSFGSNFNIGYRGIKSIGADVAYRLNALNNISATYYSFSQNPSYFNAAGALFNIRQTGSERYELKYNYTPLEYAITAKLQHLYYDVFNIRSESNGIGFDFRPRAEGDLRFFISVNGAYVSLLDYNLKPYFASQVRSNLRYKGLTTNIRYFYGPYQSYEQILFAKNKVNNQSFYSNTNLKLWLIKNSLTFEPNFNYSYETLYKRSRISIRPELYYIPKSGVEFRFYGQYLNNSQKSNPLITLNAIDNFDRLSEFSSSSNYFFGFGVKKSLGVPVSRKKYHKLGVSIFKDLNGNGKQDKNEAGLSNVLVNIKSVGSDSTTLGNYGFKDVGENFVTDSEGKISYKNLPKGRYSISILPLTETNGFFVGNEKIIKVEKDELVAMALNQGVQLTGSLIVDRDLIAADSDRELDVSKIRITAMDSLGKTYTTLTDAKGFFNMRLPVGTYYVSINESALPDNFELEERRILVEMITVADNYNIGFILHEKKRKLKMKKFDAKGNEIKEQQ